MDSPHPHFESSSPGITATRMRHRRPESSNAAAAVVGQEQSTGNGQQSLAPEWVPLSDRITTSPNITYKGLRHWLRHRRPFLVRSYFHMKRCSRRAIVANYIVLHPITHNDVVRGLFTQWSECGVYIGRRASSYLSA